MAKAVGERLELSHIYYLIHKGTLMPGTLMMVGEVGRVGDRIGVAGCRRA